MSPFSTFHSSGSSSRLVLRRKRPKRVSRSASVNILSPPVAGGRIVRNFTSRKDLPCSPGRCCANKTGRPSVAATASATTASSGSHATAVTSTSATSNSRFTRAVPR